MYQKYVLRPIEFILLQKLTTNSIWLYLKMPENANSIHIYICSQLEFGYRYLCIAGTYGLIFCLKNFLSRLQATVLS